jgi:hypothetical protein
MTRNRSVVLLALASATAVPLVVGQDTQLSAAQLKEMITNAGYEVKALNEEAGKEKFEFTVKTEEFDVPIAAEISGSRNYVWLTVYLGDAPKPDSTKCHAMLSRNFKIQPSQFYITERGALMMGFAMENRNMNPVVFRRTFAKLADDVVKTADIWNAKDGGWQ